MMSRRDEAAIVFALVMMFPVVGWLMGVCVCMKGLTRKEDKAGRAAAAKDPEDDDADACLGVCLCECFFV